MYWDYVKEREGVEVILEDYGFALVRIETPEVLYLQDIYIKPEHRLTGKGRELLSKVEELAKELGMTKIQGTVCPNTNGCTESLKSLLATGFKLQKSDEYLIYFIKEVT